jgi:phosphopantetheine adenylyltransferase
MIFATRNEDGSYTPVSGHRRLMASLQVLDKVEVTIMGTNEKIYVHQIDGKLVAVSEETQANLDDLVNAAVNRAKG